MILFPGSIPAFAAAAGIAAMLLIASPVLAADGALTAGQIVAAAVKFEPGSVERRALRKSRIAKYRFSRPQDWGDGYRRSVPDCGGGGWCGRQFVLMIGIGF